MYTLHDLSMMSGLTERTLRTYLKMGVLNGRKENGVWQFDIEAVAAFFENDFVKGAIKTNRKGLIFDYLRTRHDTKNSACVVLDIPNADGEAVARFFCDAVCKRTALSMTFDQDKGNRRVILIGPVSTVCDILCEYRTTFENTPESKQNG
ncbi:MAG: MerR family transcriptional regulator [Clostridia bacterium]|nr:MerR family transcriptional regulator [Clostridia bacterium]